MRLKITLDEKENGKPVQSVPQPASQNDAVAELESEIGATRNVKDDLRKFKQTTMQSVTGSSRKPPEAKAPGQTNPQRAAFSLQPIHDENDEAGF